MARSKRSPATTRGAPAPRRRKSPKAAPPQKAAPGHQVNGTLKQREEWSRRIIEAAPGGIVIVNTDGSFQMVNPEALRILGRTRAQLMSRQVRDYDSETINEDGSPCRMEDYPATRCLRTGVAQPPQTIGVRRPDGTTSWAVYSAVPLKDAAGALSSVLVTFFDITERKRTEESLRKSEAFHRLIAEVASDYAFSCRVDPDGSFHMETVTDGFKQVTGYSLDEVEARGGWTILIHPDDLPATPPNSERLRAGQEAAGEIRIITKAGETRWIHFMTHPIWDRDRRRVTHFLGAAHDITERKLAQAKLEEYAQRLQSLSRRLLEVQEQERRHLARELHDEIGQALTALRLTLDSHIRQPGAASLTETQRLLQDLTAQVRDLSLRLRPTMLDDFGLVSALLWLSERFGAQAKVHVDFQHQGLEKRLPAPLETAAYRIVQEALTNVARHAGASAAHVRVWRDGSRLFVQIADPGRGFDPRAVLLAHTSSGLSGMHERADLLGGRLIVDAAPGAGTVITAELPVGS